MKYFLILKPVLTYIGYFNFIGRGGGGGGIVT